MAGGGCVERSDRDRGAGRLSLLPMTLLLAILAAVAGSVEILVGGIALLLLLVT